MSLIAFASSKAPIPRAPQKQSASVTESSPNGTRDPHGRHASHLTTSPAQRGNASLERKSHHRRSKRIAAHCTGLLCNSMGRCALRHNARDKMKSGARAPHDCPSCALSHAERAKTKKNRIFTYIYPCTKIARVVLFFLPQ